MNEKENEFQTQGTKENNEETSYDLVSLTHDFIDRLKMWLSKDPILSHQLSIKPDSLGIHIKQIDL